jgi:hypothetical protein
MDVDVLHSPLKVNFNFDDNSGSYTILNDTVVNEGAVLKKNSTQSYKVFDNGDIEKTFD